MRHQTIIKVEMNGIAIAVCTCGWRHIQRIGEHPSQTLSNVWDDLGRRALEHEQFSKMIEKARADKLFAQVIELKKQQS